MPSFYTKFCSYTLFVYGYDLSTVWTTLVQFDRLFYDWNILPHWMIKRNSMAKAVSDVKAKLQHKQKGDVRCQVYSKACTLDLMLYLMWLRILIEHKTLS